MRFGHCLRYRSLGLAHPCEELNKFLCRGDEVWMIRQQCFKVGNDLENLFVVPLRIGHRARPLSSEEPDQVRPRQLSNFDKEIRRGKAVRFVMKIARDGDIKIAGKS